jgi:ubiquinol-cytochrome c reductase cytochrome c1 subunit
MNKIIIIFLLLFSNLALANKVEVNEDTATFALHPKKMKWEFDGIFGRFDRASIQRGYKVYREVCSACHAMKQLSFRNLNQIGFSEKEIKQIAGEYLVSDGPNDEGEMFERAGLPSDKFVSPYVNEQSARSANGGAYPPDLSLIIKARHDGANYVYSLLTGYKDAPDGFNLASGKNYNQYFEGRQISMPSPIIEDQQVEYRDGTYSSKEQMIIDVVNFLHFSAEPEMENRKKMGARTMIFLAVLLVILVMAKRAIWQKVK